MADYQWSMMPVEARSEDDNLMRGTINLSRADLNKFAPQYTGHTQIFVMKNVAYMENYKVSKGTSPYFEDKDLTDLESEAKMHARNLKNLINYCSIAYSGTPDLSLGTASVETGYSGVSVEVPTNAAFDGTEFTIRILEQRGEPLRKGIEFYATGIYDPIGNISHLHGSDHTFSPENYTMEIAVVQFDPRMRQIQDVSYWQNVTLQPVDRSNLDWSQGEVRIVEPRDVRFKGRYVANAEQLLKDTNFKSMLKKRIELIKRMKQFDLKISPGSTSTGP